MIILRALFCFSVLALSFGSAQAAPGYKGALSFSEGEKLNHLIALKQIAATASRCLRADLDRHTAFMDKYGVSAFYGDQSTFARKRLRTRNGETMVDTTVEEKREKLRNIGLSRRQVKELIPEGECNLRDCPQMMQPTSCIGLTRKCLEQGFRAGGQAELWDRLDSYVLENGETGDSLLNGLQMLGWKIIYWSPDLKMHAQWDLEEQAKYPGNPRGQWGHHAFSYVTVTRKNRYYLNTVDDFTSAVGFGWRTPAIIRQAPLFVGIAHLGYHVFPGTYGMVIEGHSARQVTDPNTIEAALFAPLAPTGAPRGGPFRSGIIAVPPAF